MQLCRNPARDVTAWLAASNETAPAASHVSEVAAYVQLCRNPARDVTAWLAASNEAVPAVSHVSEVVNYVRLCQNPANDLRAWLADPQQHTTGGEHDGLESTDGLYRVELHEMQNGLDANEGGFGSSRLLTRPQQPADSAELDGVRPLRAEGGLNLARDATEATRRRRRRRRAMLEAFMIVGRAMVLNLGWAFRIRKRKGGAATRKGKASGGGRAEQLRVTKFRSRRRALLLQRLMRVKAKAAPLRPRDPRPQPPRIPPPRA